MDLCLELHKLTNLSSNSSKVNFEDSVHLLIYIRENKNLGLKYYAKIEDAPISDLLKKDIIDNEIKLMVFYD